MNLHFEFLNEFLFPLEPDNKKKPQGTPVKKGGNYFVNQRLPTVFFFFATIQNLIWGRYNAGTEIKATTKYRLVFTVCAKRGVEIKLKGGEEKKNKKQMSVISNVCSRKMMLCLSIYQSIFSPYSFCG